MRGEYEPFIRAAVFFQGLQPGSLDRLCAACTVRSAEEGSFLFRQEEPAEHACMLARGRVKLGQVTEDGQQVTMRIIVPGKMFGGVAMLGTRGLYPASAQAMEDSGALFSRASLFCARPSGWPPGRIPRPVCAHSPCART